MLGPHEEVRALCVATSTQHDVLYVVRRGSSRRSGTHRETSDLTERRESRSGTTFILVV
jgi:hypothetical protein